MAMAMAQDERSKIPDLMNLGSIPSDLAMDVDTEVLDPVINNQTFCRFVLSNKGFLHSFSKITLGMLTPQDGTTLPVGVGVYSLIRRCALRIGTTIVSETDDFNHYMNYKSMFIDNDTNLERETYLTSRSIAHKLQYDNTLNQSSNINASFLCLDNGYEQSVNVGGVGGNTKPNPAVLNDNKPVFSVSLADLFPFLRFNQLPLYMIDQQISVELYFEPATTFKRCCSKATGAGGVAGTLYDIDLTQTKFIADYIYYDGDMMSDYRSQNPTLNWDYQDMRLNKRSLTVAQLETQQVFDIGGAGRLIPKVCTAISLGNPVPDDSMLNGYISNAPETINNNNALATTNLIYNDNRLYPIDRSNPAVHFHDVVQTEQNIPHILRQEYNKQGNSLSPIDHYNNHPPSSSITGLNGNFFWLCYRLNRNERINSRGLQLQLQYTNALANGGQVYTHRTWLFLVKTATLSNGKFSTDFS